MGVALVRIYSRAAKNFSIFFFTNFFLVEFCFRVVRKVQISSSVEIINLEWLLKDCDSFAYFMFQVNQRSWAVPSLRRFGSRNSIIEPMLIQNSCFMTFSMYIRYF